jgi:endonuclease/exonuclease/phosphatase family metal-dependent hydrolase
MKIRLVVAALATLLSLVAGAPAARAATGPAPLPTMTFNACGNVCRHGELDFTGANIAYQIRARGIAVAMLQELCYSQFVAVRDRLTRYGYSALFAAASKGSHCADYDHRHGRAFGVALIARGTVTDAVAHRLASPSPVRAESRIVLGATVSLPGRTVFAVTTHTAPSGPNLSSQLAAISTWLTPVSVTRPVVFGGDLNSQPGSADLAGFYSAFTEADPDRDAPLPTFMPTPRKIDFLFGSAGYLTRQSDSRFCSGYSDHCMFFGTFR